VRYIYMCTRNVYELVSAGPGPARVSAGLGRPLRPNPIGLIDLIPYYDTKHCCFYPMRIADCGIILMTVVSYLCQCTRY
jgi:hypothetical protein